MRRTDPVRAVAALGVAPPRSRLALYASLAMGWAFYQLSPFWQALSTPGSLLEPALQNRLSPGLALGLGAVLLWRRRSQLWRQMASPTTPWAVLLGLGFLVSGPLLPPPAGLLAGLGGLFIAFFGGAALVPAVVLGAYLLVLLYPDAVSQFASEPYAESVLLPVTWLTRTLGYPVASYGANVTLFTASGSTFWATVTDACAGPTTTALFLALFAFMMLDRPLPPLPATALLLAGVLGTWLQNVVRVSGLLIAGYYGGEAALWNAHEYLAYIIFPLWFFSFAGLYLWVADLVKRPAAVRGMLRGVVPQGDVLP